MALILNFDTSTRICSVALSEGNQIISLREDKQGRNHASMLTVFIQEVLREAGKSPADLQAIAVSKGPGSYTGLRIGVSTAKGMAYALSIPVIALPTLRIMVSGYLSKNQNLPEKALLCPMIDARRMEVFTSFFTPALEEILSTRADIIEPGSYSELRKDHVLILFGDGAEKCENILQGNEILIDTNYFITAADMTALSMKEFEKQNFEDTAYFEPYYLKDFVATIPKNKIL
jgi:tRNA threonylcarbamoyladenosine biosynthesis protein TsaB